MSKIVLFILLSAVFLTMGCARNKKIQPIDPQSIVSLSTSIKVDDELKDIKIDIPKQKTVKFWPINIQTDLDIENIHKTFEYKKELLASP